MVSYNKPLALKSGVTLKNRIMMAPMTTKLSFYDGVVTQDELAYYRLRSGEVAAVITAASNVQAIGKGWEGELSIASDAMIERLSELAATIKVNGTKAFIQLFHAGRMTNSKILRGETPVSASAIKAERPQAELPRSLLTKEVYQVIEDFKLATIRAIKAGFDGVELHGANTYLLQQFFSPHSNRRTDIFGGSLEKRYHFIDLLTDEVIQTVKTHADRPFAIGYRFSPEELEEPGIKFSDTLFLVDKLADKSLDYLHVSLPDYTKISMQADYKEKTILTYLNETIHGRIPLIGVGNVRTETDVKAVLEQASLVAVGRFLILDPNWTIKIMTHKEHLIRREVTRAEGKTLLIGNGLWEFLDVSMKDRIK